MYCSKCISYSGKSRGEVRQPEDRGPNQTTQLLFSCSPKKTKKNPFLARLPSRIQRSGRSLAVMEQNSFFDNDIKGDGCLCVWSGACLKCSDDSGVVRQVHCCVALGMIICCYRHESLKTTDSVTPEEWFPLFTCWSLNQGWHLNTYTTPTVHPFISLAAILLDNSWNSCSGWRASTLFGNILATYNDI